MKQWNVEINPKCEHGNELFVTAKGKVRPCFWISERSEEKEIFDSDDNFNINKTPLNEIVDVHLKKFTDDVRKDPYNALKVCFYECSVKNKD